MSTRIKSVSQMNREQRRAWEKQQRVDLAGIPEWKKAELAAKAETVKRLSQQGISPADLKAEYERGRNDVLHTASRMCMKFFYAGAAIVLHRDFHYGKDRILRFLDALNKVMTEEIDAGEILTRAKDETGVEIRVDTDDEVV